MPDLAITGAKLSSNQRCRILTDRGYGHNVWQDAKMKKAEVFEVSNFSESENVNSNNEPVRAHKRKRGRASLSLVEPDNPGSDATQYSDEELVRRSTSGDKEAYKLLVQRYQARVQAIAYEIVRNHQDAEDVAQEAFVKAYLSLKHFKGESSFYTWLYRIVFNMAVDFKRKFARRGGAHVEYKEYIGVNPSGDVRNSPNEVKPLESGANSGIESPDDALLRKEKAQGINEALDTLSEDHRAVVVLREIDGLNYEEISKVLGVPRGTVMSRLFYARKMLQKALQEFLPSSED